jgi:Spy/CpxP family protein refolding chaperone
MRSIHLAGIALALTISGAVGSAQATTASPSAPNAASPQTAVTRDHHHARYQQLFRGVQLTADQQNKVRALHHQHRSQARTLRQQLGSARTTFRTARQSKDTAAMTAARTNMHAVRTQFVTLRTQWMTETRAVLTPDQQAQFDANVAALKAQHQDRHKT